jgi:hypothetical protein
VFDEFFCWKKRERFAYLTGGDYRGVANRLSDTGLFLDYRWETEYHFARALILLSNATADFSKSSRNKPRANSAIDPDSRNERASHYTGGNERKNRSTDEPG